MFQSLQDRLNGAFKSLKGEAKINEVNIADTVKEIRRALVDADVNYATARDFTKRVREKAMGEGVLTAVSPGQMMTKIVSDELTELMGGATAEFKLEGKPAVVLMAGLQGSGKTTFTGKLAQYLKNKYGRKVLMAACDVYRPAAIDQLHVLGEQIDVAVYSDKANRNPVSIAENAVEHAKQKGFSVVIVDTAGRLAVDAQMMTEIYDIKKAINPSETLFVVDSMTGQDAVNTAKTFDERIDFDGVVLTKLDGDTRGGAALSIRSVVNKPIKFISTGEKLDKIDVFHPDRMASRILGMGDVVSLVERAQEQIDEKEAADIEKRMKKNQLDFNDFIKQMKMMRRMGGFKNVLSMVPGMSNMLKDVDIDEKQFKRLEAIVGSMTPYEREHPDLMAKDKTRKKRIAAGSGNSLDTVNQFIKNFNQMRKQMQMLSNSNMRPPKGGKSPKRKGSLRSRLRRK